MDCSFDSRLIGRSLYRIRIVHKAVKNREVQLPLPWQALIIFICQSTPTTDA